MCLGCGRTLQDSAGEFGWPVQDPESTSPGAGGTASIVSMAEPCQWRISGTHGERIVVNVSELRLASSDCVTDYLEVRDGHWYRSPLLGQLTARHLRIGRLRSNRIFELNLFNGRAAILDLTKPEIAPFNPPTPKTPP